MASIKLTFAGVLKLAFSGLKKNLELLYIVIKFRDYFHTISLSNGPRILTPRMPAPPPHRKRVCVEKLSLCPSAITPCLRQSEGQQ